MIFEIAQAGVIDDAPKVAEVLRKIFFFLLTISGTIFLLAFVFSGVLYLFSRGDAKNIERAKRSTFFTLVGLLGILMIMIIFYTLSILLE